MLKGNKYINYRECPSSLQHISDINFEMVEGWGSTHYLSDPNFKSSFIHEKKLNNLEKAIDFSLNEYCGNYGSYDIIKSWATVF